MFNAPPAAAQSHRLASEIAIQSTGNDTHDESAGTSTAARSVAAQAEAPAAAAKTLQVADYLSGLGSVAPLNIVDVKPRVDGPLISVRFNGGEMVQRGEVLATIDPSPYQLQLGQAEFQLDRDRTQLAIQTQPDIVARLQDAIRSDQINVDNAKLQLSYTQVIAPIAGIVGLRLVDPGNIIHAADAVSLLDIKQIQPIAVLFNTPEDNLSQVRTRLRSGANLPVEAWNRDSTVKIATGRLMAFDNQIDPATGAVKLKAVFDNKDEALFPNQFVNVRLFLSDRQ
jgi:multidrug efflux system membrane fusion protein